MSCCLSQMLTGPISLYHAALAPEHKPSGPCPSVTAYFLCHSLCEELGCTSLGGPCLGTMLLLTLTSPGSGWQHYTLRVCWPFLCCRDLLFIQTLGMFRFCCNSVELQSFPRINPGLMNPNQKLCRRPAGDKCKKQAGMCESLSSRHCDKSPDNK